MEISTSLNDKREGASPPAHQQQQQCNQSSNIDKEPKYFIPSVIEEMKDVEDAHLDQETMSDDCFDHDSKE
ncbi:hypothetical protein BX616_003626, partial [Lobosporangium transversale]